MPQLFHHPLWLIVPAHSCNAAASSLAPRSLSQEQQKPFQPSGISAHHLKLLSCCSSCTFSEFISMQMTAICWISFRNHGSVRRVKLGKSLEISSRVFQWLKWVKQILVAYMVLWNTKNAGKLFWKLNENIAVLFIWKCNHLWHVFKILFLCSIKLVRNHNKTAWVWSWYKQLAVAHSLISKEVIMSEIFTRPLYYIRKQPF